MITSTSHFTPLVHTLTTPDLSSILQRSNLTSINQLLNPFSQSVSKVTVRSPNYQPRQLESFPIEFQERPLPVGWDDVDLLDPSSTRARSASMKKERSNPINTSTTTSIQNVSQNQRDELFLDQVSSQIGNRVEGWVNDANLPEIKVRPVMRRKHVYREDNSDGEEAKETITEENVEEELEGWEGKSIEELTPWYAALRDQVFARRELVEWETWGWPVGCIIALSTSHPDPLNALSLLWNLTSPSNLYSSQFPLPPSSSPSSTTRQEWINPDLLRYVLIVHDLGGAGAIGDQEETQRWNDAKKLEEMVKKTYGVHTVLLPLFGNGQDQDAGNEGGEEDVKRCQELERLFPSSSANTNRRGGEVGLGVEGGYGVEPPQTPKTLTTGRDLTSRDIDQLYRFMRELVVQSIIPWIERSVVVGNEQFTSSKKSIGGRLFSVGRKYFGGGGSSSPSSNVNSRAGSPVGSGGGQEGYNSSKGYYSYQVQESQSRRLADLAFMLGDYKLAAGIYDQCSKDFKNDKAWKHYSAALRMTGLCHLLSHPPNVPLPSSPSPDQFLLSSIIPSPSSPNSPPSSLDLDLLRSTMLYHHLYLQISDLRFSSIALMRAAGELEEVVCAMLIEQAALSELRVVGAGGRRGRKRKFAMEMVLAGVRYEKCGLKSLSRRCLSQAASIYSLPSTVPSLPSSDDDQPRTTFLSIRNHLHHSLGRQAYNVGQSFDALVHFLQLLTPRHSSRTTSIGGTEVIPSGEEVLGEGEETIDWLDDFSLAWELLGQGNQSNAERIAREGGLSLPVRLFDEGKFVRVSRAPRGGTGMINGEASDEREWKELEREMMGERASGQGWKTDQVKAEGKLKDDEALVGETFYLELPITNPLEAFLSIGGLSLEIETQGDTQGKLEMDQTPEGDLIELAPLESRIIRVPVRSDSPGTYSFRSLSYRFHNLLPVTETLEYTSKRRTLASKTLTKVSTTPIVKLRPPIPNLSISTIDFPTRLFHGETRVVKMALKNDGRVGLQGLKAISAQPAFASFIASSSNLPPNIYQNQDAVAGRTSATVSNEIKRNESISLLEDGKEIAPGQTIEVSLMVRGELPGVTDLRWVFAYESTDDSSETFSARATHRLEVQPSLELRAATRPSARGDHPFMLHLEAYNHGIPASDARITSVSLFSPLWKIATLPQVSFEDITSNPIGWQQVSNLAFALDKVDDLNVTENVTKGIEWNLGQVEALLEGKKVESKNVGTVKMHHTNASSNSSLDLSESSPLLSSILSSHLDHRLSSLSTQFPTLSPAVLRNLFPLFSPISAVLLVQYSAPSLNLTGHHLINLPSIGASQNHLERILTSAETKAGGLYEESQRERSALIKSLRESELGREEDPAKVFVEVEGVQEHDFTRGPLSLPITFVVRNVSPTTSFHFTLTLGTSSESSLVYSGLLVRRATVEPLSTSRITATAFIVREGVYDVGGWELRAVAKSRGTKWTQVGSRKAVRISSTTLERALTTNATVDAFEQATVVPVTA